MKFFDNIKDKSKRRQERREQLNYQFAFADSIHFVHSDHWDSIAFNNTIFLSRSYLSAIEKHSPENTLQRYAIAYDQGQPVLIAAFQIADIGGERLLSAEDGEKNILATNYNERVLVCGNLVSSGLHGVAHSDLIDSETAWRITAEALYKLRRSEKLGGEIDFVLIKDIKGADVESSEVIERYSYRRIQTDPDMVLELNENVSSFDDYLGMLSSKYRSRIRKIIKEIDEAGLICEELTVTEENDKTLHSLYMQVERQSKTRLATLPEGYFHALATHLKDNFCCYGIRNAEEIIGFISVIKDGEVAIAYYVGFDYEANDKHPLYFRLLQLVIDAAITFECKKVAFGRSALEPKANLGAKPVDTFVWARHRVPVINYFVRKLFRNIPFDEAPERSAIKK